MSATVFGRLFGFLTVRHSSNRSSLRTCGDDSDIVSLYQQIETTNTSHIMNKHTTAHSSGQKVHSEFTGTDLQGSRCHLVRLVEGERVVLAQVMKGDDAANDFMLRHGLVATNLDHISPRREVWSVEAAPTQEEIEN